MLQNGRGGGGGGGGGHVKTTWYNFYSYYFRVQKFLITFLILFAMVTIGGFVQWSIVIKINTDFLANFIKIGQNEV